MNQQKSILYAGSDEILFEEIKISAPKLLKNYMLEFLSYQPGKFLEVVEEHLPNLLILENAVSMKNIAKELNLLKKLTRFRPTTIVVVCNDVNEVASLAHLTTVGVQLFFVKGGDLETFLKDCFYFAFDEKMKNLKFATAVNLEIKQSVGVVSSLTAISKEYMLIETDICFDAEELRINQAPFFDHPNLPFKIETHTPSRFRYDMLETYKVTYPYVGPWDEVTTETIPQSAVEDWMSLQEGSFENIKDKALVISSQEKLNSTYSVGNTYGITLSLYDSPPQELKGFLDLKRPALIIADFDENFNVDECYEMVQATRAIDEYHPIFVVFNSPSSSDALRKVFNIHNLVASGGKFSIDLVLQMAQKHSQRIPDSLGSELKYLKPEDHNRAVSLVTEVEITSLSEHEVSISTEMILPFFTVIEFNSPFHFYVTIIPPYRTLEKRRDKHTYQGVIHGLGEEKLENLRKIVNQLIYKPVKELTNESVEQMLRQKFVEAQTPLPPSVEEACEVAILENSSEESLERFQLGRQYKDRRKSKL